MEFTAAAEKYDRFMGRYTRTLAPMFVDAVGVWDGMSVLDVGCGPGGLTDTLAHRVGERQVAAIDPAPQFVAACRTRHPAADVREGVAEELPWADGSFDATLSCLVSRSAPPVSTSRRCLLSDRTASAKHAAQHSQRARSPSPPERGTRAGPLQSKHRFSRKGAKPPR